MGERIPGPLCTFRLGMFWIDSGTMCRSRSSPPGPVGLLTCRILDAVCGDAEKEKYDREHLYSTAPEAATKRAIDLQVIFGDYSRGGEVRINNEQYLKRLIEIASGGRQQVSKMEAKGLQFFIIRGGAEGFLPGWLSGRNASNVLIPKSPSGKDTRTMIFDYNDLLAVFDSKGKLISSALLERPLFIEEKWRQETADKIYEAWANKDVIIYKNTSYDIHYVGLGVEDGYRGKKTVDMHKREATSGCIFIVDPHTPPLKDKSKLGRFEPKLIKDILASIGKKEDDLKGKGTIGIMRVVDIK